MRSTAVWRNVAGRNGAMAGFKCFFPREELQACFNMKGRVDPSSMLALFFSHLQDRKGKHRGSESRWAARYDKDTGA